MPKLVATKPIRLSGHRIYQPGDEFEIGAREARSLKAIGKAQDYVEPEVERDAEREVLRQQAEALGVEVDGRWGAPRLQDEIAGAQRRRQEEARPADDGAAPRGRYLRRDMTAEDTE